MRGRSVWAEWAGTHRLCAAANAGPARPKDAISSSRRPRAPTAPPPPNTIALAPQSPPLGSHCQGCCPRPRPLPLASHCQGCPAAGSHDQGCCHVTSESPLLGSHCQRCPPQSHYLCSIPRPHSTPRWHLTCGVPAPGPAVTVRGSHCQCPCPRPCSVPSWVGPHYHCSCPRPRSAPAGIPCQRYCPRPRSARSWALPASAAAPGPTGHAVAGSSALGAARSTGYPAPGSPPQLAANP